MLPVPKILTNIEFGSTKPRALNDYNNRVSLDETRLSFTTGQLPGGLVFHNSGNTK